MIPRLARYAVLVLAMVFATGTVSADSRSDARAHYQAGVKFYNGGDYQSAIREFSAAQQLAPADLNNYNLALCYDKLGDPEPAIQYYRAYLDKQPSTDKRGEIEASIARLEAAAKSIAAKKAEEARRAEETRRIEEDARRRADEDARRRADEDARRRADEDARRRDEELRRAPVGGPTGPGAGPTGPGPMGPGPGTAGGVGGGPAIGGASSSGTPGSGLPASTGDAQLDRAQSIDVGAVRDQRYPGSAGAVGGAPAGAGPDPRGVPDPRVAAANAPTGPMQGGPMPLDDKPKEKPVYRKWWFWAVVAVSAYVVYAIATEDSAKEGTNSRGLMRDPKTMLPQQRDGGMTLLRW